MVTGDNVNTAVAIAKDCGILAPDSKINPSSLFFLIRIYWDFPYLDSYEIMEGKKFRELVGGIEYENPYA